MLKTELFGPVRHRYVVFRYKSLRPKFSIMDFYLATCRQVEFSGYLVEDLRLIDIGKPETLAKAEGFCTGTLHSDAHNREFAFPTRNIQQAENSR